MKLYSDVFTLLFNDQVGSGVFFNTGDPRWWIGGGWWGVGGLLWILTQQSSTIYRTAIHLFPVPPQFYHSSHHRGDFFLPILLVTGS